MAQLEFQKQLTPLETPATPTRAVSGVEVRGVLSGSLLRLEYHLTHTSALSWEPAPSGFSETLWKKSCFEIFLADRNSPHYWEWNFAVPNVWGAFSFSGLRTRLPSEARRDAGLSALSSQYTKNDDGSTTLVLRAEIDLSFSSFLHWACATSAAVKCLDVSINTISQTESGERVHWALKHARDGQADFHRRDNFVSLADL